MSEENEKPAKPAADDHHPHGVYENFDTYVVNRTVALTNASDPAIAPLLTGAGYPPALIATKLAELNALKVLGAEQKKEYGEQYEIVDKFNDLAKTLHPVYLKQVKYGKLVFADDLAALNTLGLKGSRKRPEASYCTQALLFYEGALANTTYKTLLAARGITEAMLTDGKTGYTNLMAMIPKKKKEIGEAQMATSKRDKAWDTFDEWYTEFKKYGMLALSGVPQLREKLGWKE